jgi:hypothetical protein
MFAPSFLPKIILRIAFISFLLDVTAISREAESSLAHNMLEISPVRSLGTNRNGYCIIGKILEILRSCVRHLCTSYLSTIIT